MREKLVFNTLINQENRITVPKLSLHLETGVIFAHSSDICDLKIEGFSCFVFGSEENKGGRGWCGRGGGRGQGKEVFIYLVNGSAHFSKLRLPELLFICDDANFIFISPERMLQLTERKGIK